MEPLRQKKIAPAIVALGCAISVGLSYSMLPASVVLFGVSVYLWRKKFVEVFGFFASSFLVVFLPILFFEVRHNFFFIHRLFLGATLNAGKSFGILDNLKELATILLGSNIQGFHFVFFALIALGLWKKRSMFLPILLMVGTWVATALSPTQIPPHYAFGVLTLFLFVLTILPKKILLVAVLLCIYLWSRPVWRQLYAAPIRRTISQLESCTRMICSSEKSPFFVTQNSWYLYHYATEYLYFLNKNGCNAYDITTDPGKAEKMLVIADNNEFTFGKTAFNELTLFGSAKLEGEYSCSGNIKAYVLTK
ncbi:MAG TPA: hypothetical protein VLH19_00850 [Patescibacteria group bacterium]|nr:hypothetical protein [Patescibacteria group bacterium]